MWNERRINWWLKKVAGKEKRKEGRIWVGFRKTNGNMVILERRRRSVEG